MSGERRRYKHDCVISAVYGVQVKHSEAIDSNHFDERIEQNSPTSAHNTPHAHMH